MITWDISRATNHKGLDWLAGRRAGVGPDMILTFGDFVEFLADLLRLVYRPSCNLVCAGHVTPEVAMAADRADMKLLETLGDSPFTGNVFSALSQIKNDFDIVYVANPNRITAANLSLTDLNRLVEVVPQGWLVIDEGLYDYFGTTGVPLLEVRKNLVVLRSFTVPLGIRGSEAGFAVADRQVAAGLKDALTPKGLSRGLREKILTRAADEGAIVSRIKEIHEESLRVAVLLTRLGIQCRISASDFLLIRVASPKDVGNFLAASKVSVENLDGYPLMKNYIRYYPGPRHANDMMVAAFTKMPRRFYRMPGYDCRPAIQHRRRVNPCELEVLRSESAGIPRGDVKESEMVSSAVDR